jgi:DNA mismatch endonuclease (patch repair protein)
LVDRIPSARRSWNMSRIRDKDTVPELTVRSYLHRIGLRYRLHAIDLPGKPDLVFRSAKLCVFVHGCFWHGCKNCVDGRRRVRSNSSYWHAKVSRNRARDKQQSRALRKRGWTVFTIWECQTKSESCLSLLSMKIHRALRESTTNSQ